MPEATKLTQARSEETIVISGISGCFPESENLYQFRDRLFNKEEFFTNDDRRWVSDPLEPTDFLGKVPGIEKFDASFFGLHPQHAEMLDPAQRTLFEKTYEAIVDAGVNPHFIKGQKVGVFLGSCALESQGTWLYHNLDKSPFFITGNNKPTWPQRISYWLGVNGPSICVDSACSSSMYALDNAYWSIRNGLCDAAIVAGCHVCLHPKLNANFVCLGVISHSGRNKVFDEDTDGYVRSEATCSVFLQKARDAKRVYAEVVYVRTNCDGYKEQGITYPSGMAQEELLKDFYKECAIDPTSLDYLEAHGTGTRAGDLEELNALSGVFCRERTTPLPIGSVKSNMGHSEPTATMCSIAKVIIAMETGFVAPNVDYKKPREAVPALTDGQFKVVTEKYPLDCRLVGISSFGFGGANGHTLLRWNQKNKMNGGAPADSLPRLVVASGRTEEAVDAILKDFESRPVDAEFVALMHNVQSEKIVGHNFRGYTLLTQDNRKLRDIQFCCGSKRPVWFVFTGMGSQWNTMGKTLLKIPTFAATIEKCQQALKPYGVNLYNIITTDDPAVYHNIINCFVGIVSCQLGLVDVLKAVGITADGLVGVSVGELGCGYADGCLTAEQAVLAAYCCGRALAETKLSKGLMATVGLSVEQAKKLCPPDVEVACHYGGELCVLSGPASVMRKFMATLKNQGVFTEELNCADTAYHSRQIAAARPALLKYMEQLIPSPKPRSSKWVSSSVPQSAWKTALATYCSAEYFTNNLLSPVLFQEASRHIPADAITIEVAPHGLLQAILHKSCRKTRNIIALMERGHPNSTELLLVNLGRLFELGLQPKLAKLYPPVEYPVSRGTPMISPLIKWDHSRDWHVPRFASPTSKEIKTSNQRTVTISLEEERMEYLSGHVVDGRNLFPAMGYIVYVWESFANMHDCVHTDTSIVFENVHFIRATNIPKEGSIKFVITVQKSSGIFEVFEGGASVVTGKVRFLRDNDDKMTVLAPHYHTSSNNLIELNSRDIYKELRLRGYNYKGLFRGAVSIDGHGKTGKIHWCNNWVTFMDIMLQLRIVTEDTRSLFVPTGIEKLVIDIEEHALVTSDSENEVLPVDIYRELDIMRVGGVELRGLKASSIARRKPLGTPVLEKYVFVPHAEPDSLDLHTALRVCMHMVLENQTGVHVKAAELHQPGLQPLSPELARILGDLPLIQADITLVADATDPAIENLDIVGFKVEGQKLKKENCNLIITSQIVSDSETLATAMEALAEGGCILSRERPDTNIVANGSSSGMQVVFEKTFKEEKLILLKKGTTEDLVVILVSEKNYKWLPQLKTACRSNAKQQIILVAQGEPLNGILGLVNCIRIEPLCESVRCFFIMDESAPAFDVNLPIYRQQLKKNLAINVYSNGQWGSYRHLPLESPSTVPVPHALANITTRGDLSSMKWLQGNLDCHNIEMEPVKELVHIYYTPLNFRDVMNASGKLAVEMGVHRSYEDCLLGFEFSGRNEKGKRVMGMVANGALSSMVIADKGFLFDIPDHWTLEDAATVPVVYGTVFYALVMKGQIQRGESVLIHAGSGGVGQAAINVCLHLGCTIFTTVGTEEKREFIKKTFPQLTERNIGNSRDTSFEQLIMKETGGKGVDIVLNSLADEKLQASIRCLAENGRFLEIGKYDILNDSPLDMGFFSERKSFHAVLLDTLFTFETNEEKREIGALLEDGIKSGAVKPLVRTVFPHSEVEQAFRFMATGKHIGKVMLQIREEEKNTNLVVPSQLFLQATPLFFCNPERTYVIVGGLGGFGLELADWLVLRGARKLMLNSRSGLKTGYQSSRVRTWRNYGCTVLISQADVTTKEGVASLLSEATKLGPVDAIFNLAAVLRDGLLENQSEADFVASSRPKSVATRHLDALSREMCPDLRHFVVFSSVSCGRGNAGQTNYGMSNSVMERVCEARVRDGLPGLAVQWGAVGDVGLVADMLENNTELVIGGTIPQRISSCLEELDGFMRQDCPVVASMVVAEKRVGSGEEDNPVDCICHILGIKDLKAVSTHATLSELGMDSLMIVEVKQTLERSMEVFLTAQEIRNLTLARIMEMNENLTSHGNVPKEPHPGNRDDDPGIQIIHHLLGNEATADKRVVQLKSAVCSGNDSEDPILFLVPGLEGMASVFEKLARNLRYQTFCLQLNHTEIGSSVQDMAKSLLPHIVNQLPPGASFNLLGFSFGGLVAMEMALELEKQGREGNLYLVDSSPEYIKRLQHLGIDGDENEFQVRVIKSIVTVISQEQSAAGDIPKIMEEIAAMTSWEKRIERVITMLPNTQYNIQYQKDVYTSICARLKATRCYEWIPTNRVKTNVTLIRPTISVSEMVEDYGLSQYFENVKVHFVKGDHVTILNNEETAHIVNK